MCCTYFEKVVPTHQNKWLIDVLSMESTNKFLHVKLNENNVLGVKLPLSDISENSKFSLKQ